MPFRIQRRIGCRYARARASSALRTQPGAPLVIGQDLYGSGRLAACDKPLRVDLAPARIDGDGHRPSGGCRYCLEGREGHGLRPGPHGEPLGEGDPDALPHEGAGPDGDADLADVAGCAFGPFEQGTGGGSDLLRMPDPYGYGRSKRLTVVSSQGEGQGRETCIDREMN